MKRFEEQVDEARTVFDWKATGSISEFGNEIRHNDSPDGKHMIPAHFHWRIR